MKTSKVVNKKCSLSRYLKMKGVKKTINFSSTSKRESTITLSVSCIGLNSGQTDLDFIHNFYRNAMLPHIVYTCVLRAVDTYNQAARAKPNKNNNELIVKQTKQIVISLIFDNFLRDIFLHTYLIPFVISTYLIK